ncbi:hypothetical protein C0J52_25409 [Blattella germanica]|nr:hypothetical protein C0J52_25409 [Blattella germanica]
METLIELVKNHPCLYDTNHEDYVKTKVKEEIWNKIARILECPSGETVKTQWRKLRDCHRDALRRYKTKKKNGEITPLSKQWMYLKQMEFLLPYSKKKRATSPSFAENVQVEVLEIGENSMEVGETVQLESSNNCDQFIDDEESSIPAKVQKISNRSSAMNEASNYIKRRSSERDLLKRKYYYPQDNDSLLQFFMSMYHTTKAMPLSSQLKIKRGIFDVVTEEEEKFVSSPERSGVASCWTEENTFGDHQYIIKEVNEDI